MLHCLADGWVGLGVLLTVVVLAHSQVLELTGQRMLVLACIHYVHSYIVKLIMQLLSSPIHRYKEVLLK